MPFARLRGGLRTRTASAVALWGRQLKLFEQFPWRSASRLSECVQEYTHCTVDATEVVDMGESAILARDTERLKWRPTL